MGTFKKVLFFIIFILIVGGVGAVAALGGYYYGKDHGEDISDENHAEDLSTREAELEKECADEKTEIREGYESEITDLQSQIEDLEQRVGSNTLERLQGTN